LFKEGKYWVCCVVEYGCVFVVLVFYWLVVIEVMIEDVGECGCIDDLW